MPLAALVRVAGMRWSVEEQFQAAKGQAGLDHYQVRTWTGWHRFVTLAMLALAFLMASAAAAAPAPPADPWHHARHGGPIALTAAEIRRLFNGLVIAPLRAPLSPRCAPSATSSTGPTGAASTKAEPAAATTSTDSPPNPTHNEMTLPY